MKALRRQAAEGAQELALVLAEQAMGIVLDDGQVVPLGNLENHIHLHQPDPA
jgi:hypothetical protein